MGRLPQTVDAWNQMEEEIIADKNNPVEVVLSMTGKFAKAQTIQGNLRFKNYRE